MWDKTNLRNLALEREMPKDPDVRKMLVAFERYHGRTEERVQNKQAELIKLNSLIDNYKQSFPVPKVYEHPSLKELRAYVADYQYAQEQKKSKDQANRPPVLDKERENEPERSR